jgi:hypothetical protein
MVLLDNQIVFNYPNTPPDYAGGSATPNLVLNDPKNNLFPDLPEEKAVEGVTAECRMIIMTNLSETDNAVKITPWIEQNSNNPNCRIFFGIGASGINASELTLPTPYMLPPNVEFYDFTNMPTQPLIVKLGPKQSIPFWFNWKTNPETPKANDVSFKFSVIVEREPIDANQNPNINCPPPQVLDPSTGDCVTPIICFEDEVFDPITRTCLPDPDSGGGGPDPDPDPTPSCPEGQFWDTATQQCKPIVVNPPPTGTIPVRSFAAVGDFDSNARTDDTFDNIREGIITQIVNPTNSPLGMLLALGDFSYIDGNQKPFIDRCKTLNDLFPTWIKTIIGNHDDTEDGAASDRTAIINAFGMPSEGYYAFTWENIRFIMMDTQKPLGAGSPQKTFVTAQLQAAASDPLIKFKIVCYHKPSVTSNGNDHGQLVTVADNYHMLFQQYKVDVVMAGHNHNSEVTWRVKFNATAPRVPVLATKGTKIGTFDVYTPTDPEGIIFMVLGGGGRSADTTDTNDPWMAHALRQYGVGFFYLRDNGNTLRFVLIESGTISEKYWMEIHK